MSRSLPTAAAPPSATTTLLDRALPRAHMDINESLFAVLFAELCRYSVQNAQDVAGIETRLASMGFDVGYRMLELVQQHLVATSSSSSSSSSSSGGNGTRAYVQHREVRLIPALQFVTSACWQFIYGKPLDSLERSTDGNDTYLLSEKEPLPIKYASVPRDFGELNLASFNAGIIHGVLSVQGFDCAVSAHFAGGKVVYVVKFDAHVMDREAKLARMAH